MTRHNASAAGNGRGRILFVDASAGASGDMILGALVDLGAPLTRVRRALQSLPLDGWTLRSRRVQRRGIAARKIDVGVKGHQPARGWSALRRVVAGGDLEPAVRRRALAIFRRLIEAEAEVHGTTPGKVHLHEAGGTDAIIDVVGACVGLELIGPRRIVVSPMTTGYGTVRCDHGVYPVPAPATLELVRGFPIEAGDVAVERLTPTGAAILTVIADEWGRLPAMRPAAVGYGAGSREIETTPNLLRMVLGGPDDPAAGPADEVVVIECNVDDSTPQALAFAAERLLEKGALDVFLTAITMKKGRPGHLLTVLGRPGEQEPLTRTVLEQTSTIGLRVRRESRVELKREMRRVRTRYGTVPVKLATRDGRVVQAWPEYEDCAALARRNGVALSDVQQAALQALARRKRKGKR